MADEKTFTQADVDAAIEKAVGKVQESLDKLEAKNTELLDEAKKAKAELRKVKEISPDDVAAIEAERDKAIADLTAANKNAKDAAATAEKATKALETETGVTKKLVAENGLRDLLLKGGVTDPDYLDLAVGKYLPGVQVVAEGDTRKAVYGDKPLDAFVTELLASEAGKKIIAAPSNSGGGSQGGSNNAGSGKQVVRSVFEGMDQGSRAAFAKEGGRVVDA